VSRHAILVIWVSENARQARCFAGRGEAAPRPLCTHGMLGRLLLIEAFS
jgi:hypothetical protein